jgi:hypothetical protein
VTDSTNDDPLKSLRGKEYIEALIQHRSNELISDAGIEAPRIVAAIQRAVERDVRASAALTIGRYETFKQRGILKSQHR